jgi:uncharacterized protein involved in type VI secretion and phage assembly
MPVPLYGKYRGTVIDSADPNRLGRVKVSVPSVMAQNQAEWAMPCVPYSAGGPGKQKLPPAGTAVWVEFEGGNSARPVWVGCFWTK